MVAIALGMDVMTKKKAVLALCLGLLVGPAAAGCAPDFCGDHYHEGYARRCETAGNAALVAPARLDLPATLGVDGGASCLDDQGGCTSTPYLTFDSNPSDDGSVPRPRISVQLFFPQAQSAATYVITPESASVLVNAQLFTNATLRESLEVVDGKVEVKSASPERLSAAVTLTLRVASTGETLTFTSAAASASCELEPVRICDDSFNVPYGDI